MGGGELEDDLFAGAETGETCRPPAVDTTEAGETEKETGEVKA
jgi:hypothetical protein